MGDPVGLRYLVESDPRLKPCDGACGQCPEGRCWYEEQSVRMKRGLPPIAMKSWHKNLDKLPVAPPDTRAPAAKPVRVDLARLATSAKVPGRRLTNAELEGMLDNWVDGKALVVEVLATRQEMEKLRDEMEEVKHRARVEMLEEVRKLVHGVED